MQSDPGFEGALGLARAGRTEKALELLDGVIERDPGLAKAKLSYHPASRVKSYRLELR